MARRDRLSIETVKSRVVRARAALLERLERRGLFGDLHWSMAAAPILGQPRGSVSAHGTTAAAAPWTTAAPGSLTALVLAAGLLLTLQWTSLSDESVSRPSFVPLAPADSDLVSDFTNQAPDVKPTAEGERTILNVRTGTGLATAPAAASPGPIAPVRIVGTTESSLVDPRRAIKGRVTTVEGLPIQGVAIHGFPLNGGSGFGGTSDTHGDFKLLLPEAGAMTLEASHPDYVSWGGDTDRSWLFDGGAPAIAIVMETLPRAVFRVIDAATGTELVPSRFEVVLGKAGSGVSPRWPSHMRPLEISKAEFERGARARIDWVAVEAPGYISLFEDVEAGPSGLQVLALERGGTLTGRVWLAEVPIPGATVELARGWWNEGIFLSRSGSQIHVRTGADGSFEASGLIIDEPYRLRVTSLTGEALMQREVKIPPAKLLDLGDIVLGATGSVRGQLVIPVGLDVAGLMLTLGEREDGHSCDADAAGAFHFSNVTPGSYALRLRGQSNVFEPGKRTTVLVNAGESTFSTLDLTDRVLLNVAITVEVQGVAVPGVHVHLIPNDLLDASDTELSMGTAHLGKTDANGCVLARVRTMGDATVQIYGASLSHLRAPGPPLHLGPGLGSSKVLEHVASFELASVEFRLPASASLPREGTLVVDIQPVNDPAGGGAQRQYISIPVKDGRPRLMDDPFVRWEAERWTLLGVIPGPKTIAIHATEAGAPKISTELPGGGTRVGPRRLFEIQSDVTASTQKRAFLEF